MIRTTAAGHRRRHALCVMDGTFEDAKIAELCLDAFAPLTQRNVIFITQKLLCRARKQLPELMSYTVDALLLSKM